MVTGGEHRLGPLPAAAPTAREGSLAFRDRSSSRSSPHDGPVEASSKSAAANRGIDAQRIRPSTTESTLESHSCLLPDVGVVCLRKYMRCAIVREAVAPCCRGALVLQFERLGWTVLTPSLCVTIVIDHECGMCSARFDELSLERPWITNSSLVLDVVRSAPASSVDSVVPLDQLCENVPGRLVQGPDGELRCSRRAPGHGWMLRNSKPSRRGAKMRSRPLRAPSPVSAPLRACRNGNPYGAERGGPGRAR